MEKSLTELQAELLEVLKKYKSSPSYLEKATPYEKARGEALEIVSKWGLEKLTAELAQKYNLNTVQAKFLQAEIANVLTPPNTSSHILNGDDWPY